MATRLLGKSFEQIRADVEKVMGNATLIAGTEGVKHFTGSFRAQGFTDDGFTGWKPREKDKDPGRAILTKTGRLRRGIKIMYRSEKRVMVGVDLNEVPYAQVHNEGFYGAVNVKAAMHRNKGGDTYNIKSRRRDSLGIRGVKGHQRVMNIPKRQFIGESKVLNEKISKKIESELRKAFG
jgi:phage gpG-like protein